MDVLHQIISFFSSLRIRLCVLVILAGTIPCVVLSGCFLSFIKYQMWENDTIRLTAQAQVVNNDLISSGYLKGKRTETVDNELLTLSNSYSGRIMVIDPGLRILKDTYDMHEGRTLVYEPAVRSLSGSTERVYDEKNNYLILTVPIIEYENPSDVLGVLLISKSTDDIKRTLENSWSLAVILNLSVTALAFAVGAYLSMRIVKPFNRIAGGISDPFGRTLLMRSSISSASSLMSWFSVAYRLMFTPP